MNVIGIFMEGPNTGACILHEGRLVAVAEEERFTRVKRASDQFPSNSIAYCLKQAGLTLADIDCIASAWDHDKYPEHMDRFMRALPGRELDEHADLFEGLVHTALSPQLAHFKIATGLRRMDPDAAPEIRFYAHHLCHAASVHYLSGVDESAILVLDGSGEETATSTWHGHHDHIEAVDQWNLPNSLGWFYAAMTEYLGFSAYSGEGKVMGLAPYGTPDPQIARKLDAFCRLSEDHVYTVDPTFVYYGQRTYSRRFTDRLVELLGPPRRPESDLDPRHLSIAFETQARLEQIAIAVAAQLLDKTGASHLCISGGVAMNCKMNGVLSQQKGVDSVFINPASYDSGAGIGAALLALRDAGKNPRANVLEHAYLGPSFSDDEIATALQHCGLQFTRESDIGEAIAQRLANGAIVGRFDGRAEFGARALGNRSILANPLLPDVKDRVNAKVKYREAFRPFAPSMLAEVRDRYLLDSVESPFMILAYQVREEFRALFPGVVHVDGTVRPQTVSRQTNPGYWSLIDSFGKLTGHPVVLNTSFNIRGEPIVNTPLEAVRCFYSTGMDALAIGSFVLDKKQP
jgi:carbamoyltransferase